MKKQLLLSLVFTLFCGIIYGQHLIRVNNDPAADGDYLTLQEANDNAAAGDTIYVEGSINNYTEGATIDKRLTIIGPGYFLSENDSTQANALYAKFNGSIQFNTGSAGSVIAGIESHLNISVDNITVRRCKSNYIAFDAVVKNILITQNYVDQINVSYNGKITNSVISNNIIPYQINTNSNSGVLQVINNVVFGTSTTPINVYNSTISNNIITSTYNIAANTGNIITNNILGAAGTNANGNKYNIAMTTVFVDYSGSLGYSDDAKWKLKAGSPAIGAGVSGVDCGVFGGVGPYVLSGVPALPHIYEATIPGAAYSDKGLSCIIKVKSGK